LIIKECAQEKEGYGNELEELIGQFEALDQEKTALEERLSGTGEGQQRMVQDLQRLHEVHTL